MGVIGAALLVPVRSVVRCLPPEVASGVPQDAMQTFSVCLHVQELQGSQQLLRQVLLE